MNDTSYNGYIIGTDTAATGTSTTAWITIKCDVATASSFGRWWVPVSVSCADGSVCYARPQRGVTPPRNVKPHRRQPPGSRRGIVRLY